MAQQEGLLKQDGTPRGTFAEEGIRVLLEGMWDTVNICAVAYMSQRIIDGRAG